MQHDIMVQFAKKRRRTKRPARVTLLPRDPGAHLERESVKRWMNSSARLAAHMVMLIGVDLRRRGESLDAYLDKMGMNNWDFIKHVEAWLDAKEEQRQRELREAILHVQAMLS